MILPPQGDDRAEWLTHHTRTGIHHVPVRWDGLGRPHIPDDCGLNLPYLAVINPRNGDLVTWEEDVEEQLLQWCLMQPAVWMSWSDTSDEGSDEGPDYDEEEEEEPGGVWRPHPAFGSSPTAWRRRRQRPWSSWIGCEVLKVPVWWSQSGHHQLVATSCRR